ncbi:hypothetical protein MCOR13_009214 [Pyricularia oryzae]|nr:hypothetical protein MCOR13_009214 [Pyricularia oryzae]
MEVRRAQGVPDNEVLVGQFRDRWKLVGNSVARQAALALGLELRRAYFGNLYDDDDDEDAAAQAVVSIEGDLQVPLHPAILPALGTETEEPRLAPVHVATVANGTLETGSHKLSAAVSMTPGGATLSAQVRSQGVRAIATATIDLTTADTRTTMAAIDLTIEDDASDMQSVTSSQWKRKLDEILIDSDNEAPQERVVARQNSVASGFHDPNLLDSGASTSAAPAKAPSTTEVFFEFPIQPSENAVASTDEASSTTPTTAAVTTTSPLSTSPALGTPTPTFSRTLNLGSLGPAPQPESGAAVLPTTVASSASTTVAGTTNTSTASTTASPSTTLLTTATAQNGTTDITTALPLTSPSTTPLTTTTAQNTTETATPVTSTTARIRTTPVTDAATTARTTPVNGTTATVRTSSDVESSSDSTTVLATGNSTALPSTARVSVETTTVYVTLRPSTELSTGPTELSTGPTNTLIAPTEAESTVTLVVTTPTVFVTVTPTPTDSASAGTPSTQSVSPPASQAPTTVLRQNTEIPTGTPNARVPTAIFMVKIPTASATATVSPTDYQTNMRYARNYNQLSSTLDEKSACTSGQTACIAGDLHVCEDNRYQMWQDCTSKQLSCFGLPMNTTLGIFVDCYEPSFASSVLGGAAGRPPSLPSSSTSLSSTAAANTTATAAIPATTPTTTTTTVPPPPPTPSSSTKTPTPTTTTVTTPQTPTTTPSSSSPPPPSPTPSTTKAATTTETPTFTTSTYSKTHTAEFIEVTVISHHKPKTTAT